MPTHSQVRPKWRGLLAILCAVGGLASIPSCGHQATENTSALTLYVISPHGSDIRREFGEAFSRWHQIHYGTPVEVVWPDVGGGGTGNIVRVLDGAYKEKEKSDYDLIFGGGSATFGTFASKGFLVKPPPMQKDDPWEKDPIDQVPADIFGGPLHGEDGVWVAATMAAFGMEVNPQRIQELGLPTPTHWEDIAGPDWLGRVSLADPSKSGSVKTSFEMILQQYGWEKGWSVLTRLVANSVVIRDNGSGPADDVGNAEAVAGIVIDFYGRQQTMRAGQHIATFVLPSGGTTLDADPIGMLRGSPHAELAARFMRFVVSREGQRVWVMKALGDQSVKDGIIEGPRKNALGRLSVVEALYTEEPQHLFDPTDPFLPPKADAQKSTQAAEVLHFDPAKQQVRDRFIGDLIKSALLDNRPALVKARRAVRAAGDSPALLSKLEALPTFNIAEVREGQLVYRPPLLMEEKQLSTVRDEYSPKDKEKAALIERLQNGLKDFWRDSFAQRFAAVEKEATRR